MSRKPSKTIDQVEDETFIFKETDANAKPEDKRKAPKEFEVVRESTGLYAVRYSAGGEVPDTLKGRWTNVNKAQVAIENFLTTKRQQEAAQ